MLSRFALPGVMVLLMIAGMSPTARSQETAPRSGFDYTLDSLRQSVAKLAEENKAINARNLSLRDKIKALETDLRSAQAEAQRQEQRLDAMKGREPRRNDAVPLLRERLAAADVAYQKAVDEQAAQEARLTVLEVEADALQKKTGVLEAEISTPPGTASVSADLASLQQEYARRQKEFYSAANDLQTARKQWEQLNTMVTTGPQQLDALRDEKATLEQEIPALRSALAELSDQVSEAQSRLSQRRSEDHSDLRVTRLEREVRELAERRHSQEVELLAAQKAKDERLKKVQQDNEAKSRKWQQQVEKLSKRNGELRQELEDLRRQMVAMDKKRESLEAEVYSTR